MASWPAPHARPPSPGSAPCSGRCNPLRHPRRTPRSSRSLCASDVPAAAGQCGSSRSSGAVMHVALADPPAVPIPAPAAHLSAQRPEGPRGLAPTARRPRRPALSRLLGSLDQTNVAGRDQRLTPATSARDTPSPIDSSQPPAAPPWEVCQRGPPARQASTSRRGPHRKTFTTTDHHARRSEGPKQSWLNVKSWGSFGGIRARSRLAPHGISG
jgi:hypothetical protein